MGDGNPPQLKRGIFGYTSDSVRRMLADREAMFATSQQRLKESQAVVAQLQTQLQVLRQHATQRDAEVQKAAARIVELDRELGEAGERLRESDRELAEARGRLEETGRELEEARGRLQEADGVALELIAAREQLRAIQLEDDQRADQARAAESRVADLEAQLVGVRTSLEKRAREAELRADRLEAKLAAAQHELRESLERPPSAAEPATSEHVTHILETAERAATRIIELAGTTHREHVEQLDRLRSEVREETERLATWRRQLEPMVLSIRSSIERAKTKIEDVPDRIRQALDPLGQAIDSVNDRLSGLVDEASAPDEAAAPDEEPSDEQPAGDPDAAEEPVTTTPSAEEAVADAPVHPLRPREDGPPGSGPPPEEPYGRWRRR